ncbi:1,2-dihydroxy-3-keto-5-methylthiopentene dioxygenase [Drepanopeziza brunnea f. sp. 'multigermtubi' MB_m1]|uniref:Acireductone dioxygenase n=1 Tax=Marssonina brunnea f. sp. multigermtubi (strain MB_m1) TaxID=1072389 RepID=K1WJX1_MARBU|nr:1,2-dihydroxy-3-keto-5-methylthiopentene dioxygenase [Drepanopeziza brunnea f. sp. 'multigermtubi' MB_m1]EKD17995.1 1,2-dihydroxy-3-keto-5-methylthiopentene dioxygenase [Drepanopeziza brunnea f. sp. 'multigermtubi' MB_m1]
MRAYWYDNAAGDQREAHDSGRAIAVDYLSKLGVLYYHLPNEADVDQLAKERSYKNRDVITVSPEKMGDVYEEKVKSFFHEHLHEDEEIRYIRDGAGFFDVRSEGDEWVRILLEKDDLIILPAGIYHRFTTDTNNVGGGTAFPFAFVFAFACREWADVNDQQHITAMRLFKEDPKWTPLNRGPEVDVNPLRKEYLGIRTRVADV